MPKKCNPDVTESTEGAGSMRDPVHALLRSVPQGLTLGPSLANDGQLGLWCVGKVLEKGTLLGLQDPGQTIKKETVETLQTANQNVSKHKISDEMSWMRFACSAHSEETSNIHVLQLNGRLAIRVCQDIQPGKELLLWETQQATLNEELSHRKDREDIFIEARPSECYSAYPTENLTQESTFEGKTPAPSSSSALQQNVGERNPKHSSEDPAEVETESFASDSQSSTANLDAKKSFRASSRLAAKPRKVHSSDKRLYKREEFNLSEIGSEKKPIVSKDCPKHTPEEEFKIRERKYKCDECDKGFFQLCHLKKHQVTHQKQKPYTCSECGKAYSSQESFKAHLLMHQGQRPFKCQHCDKSYGLKRDLKDHQVLHSGEKPFVCDICGKAFARRPSLRIHREVHRTKEPDHQAPKIKCSVCNKELANSGSLRIHMRLHSGERPYVCQHCDKSFRQRGNLLGHLRIHTGEKPYKCNNCDLQFSQGAELRRHQISHTGEMFLCPVCGKALRDPHTLRAHERLHTGDRPYKCDQCGKAYTIATKLRRHLKSHLQDKPYICQVCGAKYLMMQSLQRHLQSHKQDSDSSHPLPKQGRPKLKQRKVERANHSTVAYVQASEDFTMVTHHDTLILDSGMFVLGKGTEKGVERIELSDDIIEIIVTDNSDKCVVLEETSTGIICQEQAANSHSVVLQENDANSSCTVVQKDDTNSCLVIIQEQDGLGSVAENIEIETGE